MFEELCADTIFVVKSDGSRHGPMKAVVNQKQIESLDDSISIEDGDKIIRLLPQNREETYTVLHAHWEQAFGDIPAAYTLDVRKDTALPRSQSAPRQVTNNFHGHNARVNIDSIDNSLNSVGGANVFDGIRAALRDSPVVVDADLREKLLALVSEMEQEPKTPAFAKRYSDFMALAANHFAVLGPFLPALSKLLPGA